MNGWKDQGAEIIYLTSRTELDEVEDIRNVLKRHDFPEGELLFRQEDEDYKSIVERIVPDILIEDDCESIDGIDVMISTHLKPEIRNKIKSITLREFGGIDHLPDEISVLLMSMDENEKTVQKGYNKIAEAYHAERDIFDSVKQLEEFTSLLPKGANILDVGCGAGVPVSKFLVDSGFEVIGIDFSDTMLGLARENAPQAKFIKMDMNQLDFQDNSFDGLTAFYSIIHVPREKHAELFQGFHRILRPGGIMLVSMGSSEWEGNEDFHGAKMFWSHYAPEKSVQMIKEAGFEIIYDRAIIISGEKHYWVQARNKKECHCAICALIPSKSSASHDALQKRFISGGALLFGSYGAFARCKGGFCPWDLIYNLDDNHNIHRPFLSFLGS